MSDAPATKRDLDEGLAGLRSELKQDMTAMEARLVRQIGETLTHVANVMMENTRSQIAAVDDKYRDVPTAADRLRADVDAHVADVRVHVKAGAPRPRARRTRSR